MSDKQVSAVPPSPEQFSYGDGLGPDPELQLLRILEIKMPWDTPENTKYQLLLRNEDGEWAFARGNTAEEIISVLRYVRSTYPELYAVRWNHAVEHQLPELRDEDVHNRVPDMMPGEY